MTFLPRTRFLACALLVSLAIQSAAFPRTVEGEPVRKVAPEASLPSAELEKWKRLASGQHSFRDLGPDFHVDLPMRRVEGAKLAYFNRPLAKRLGLQTPTDRDELQKLMTGLFALEIDPTGQSPLRMMATKYQDSDRKAPGFPLGDGRAVWTGEIEVKLPDGRTVYVDVTAKGIGQTPLAWTRNDAAHSDGRQKIREFVRSAIISRANVRNELDSTDDLMAFVVYEDGKPVRSISVRAGNQTRTAHFRFHGYQEEWRNMEKMVEYVVRRDLGLARDAKIGPNDVSRYFAEFVDNLAEETARYADLSAIHGAPTGGNRTTRGSTIDLMEFWYHDAHHGNFRYLFDRMVLEGQARSMRDYGNEILGYLQQGQYPVPENLTHGAIRQRFEEVYARELTKFWLNRLGIPPKEAAKLSPAARGRFFAAARDLHHSVGTELRPIFWQEIPPAAFDMRTVFSRTLAEWETPKRMNVIFRNDRPWATPLTDRHVALMERYLDAVGGILAEIGGPGGRPKSAWIRQASKIAAKWRMDPGEGMPASEGDPFFRKYEERILRALEDPGFDPRKVEAMIDEAADSLVDEGLVPRGLTNLGPSPGSLPPPSFAELCSFNLRPVVPTKAAFAHP
jgi:hypothetical protein